VASQVFSEVYASLNEIKRRKEFIFWGVLFPIIYLLILFSIFGNPGGSPPSFSIAVVNLDRGNFSQILISSLNSSGIFRVSVLGSGEDLKGLVERGEYSAGLIIPRGSTENLTSGRRVYVEEVYLKGVQDSEIAFQTLSSFLSQLGSEISSRAVNIAKSYIPPTVSANVSEYLEFISRPIEVRASYVEPQQLSTAGRVRAFYVVSVLGIMILFNGIFAGLGPAVERRYGGFLRVVLSSPMNGYTLYISDTLAALVRMAITLAIIFALGLALGADYSIITPGGALTLALLLLSAALGSFGIGVLLSPLPRTPEAVGALGNAVAFPVMFASGLAIPKFLLPGWMQGFSEVFPISRIVYSVINYLVYGWSVGDAVVYAAPGVAACVAIYIAGMAVHRRVLERISQG